MKPRSRKRFDGPVLSSEEKFRQGQVVRLAQEALLTTDAVRAFLNSHHGLLRGRPLDLATASRSGLLRVQQFLSAGRISRPQA